MPWSSNGMFLAGVLGYFQIQFIATYNVKALEYAHAKQRVSRSLPDGERDPVRHCSAD